MRRLFSLAIQAMAWMSGIAASSALAAAPAPASVIRDCESCPAAVVVPAGVFLMGARAGEDLGTAAASGAIEQGTPQILRPMSDSRPQRRVRIAKAFAMTRHEITYEQFAAFVVETKFEPDGKDCLLTDMGPDSNLIRQDVYATSQAVRNATWEFPPWPAGLKEPVTCVNWFDAEAYAAWLSKKTGHIYRLPSEAEWEYAARAGTSGYWYWGDDPAQACRYENVADLFFLKRRMRTPGKSDHFDCDDGYAWNAPVGSFQPNAFGLYDMVGNVSEMVADCWHADYHGAPTDGSRWAGGDCRFRVLRGDIGMLHVEWTHLASRAGAPMQQYRSTLGGFRLVREL